MTKQKRELNTIAKLEKNVAALENAYCKKYLEKKTTKKQASEFNLIEKLIKKIEEYHLRYQ